MIIHITAGKNEFVHVTNEYITAGLARGKSMRAKVTQYSTPMESIQAEVRDILEEFDDDDIP